MRAAATPNRRRRHFHALLAVVVAQVVLLILSLNVILFRDAMTEGKIGYLQRQSAEPMNVTIDKLMNRSADPCKDFYSYVCGNWDALHPHDEDVMDLIRKTVSNKTLEMLRSHPAPEEQPRATDRIAAAFQLCHQVFSQNREELNSADSYLAAAGLDPEKEAPKKVDLLEILVRLSLHAGLPVTATIGPRYDLRETNAKFEKMVMAVFSGSPALENWLTVSAPASS